MAAMAEVLAQAVAYHRAGHLEEAERIYRQLLEEDSRHADALHLLGVAAHQRGDHGKAAQYIRRAIAVNPSVAAFHSNLGLVYHALGMLPHAEDCHRRALELDPAFAAAHNNLGNSLKQQGRLDEAAASFRRALDIEPNYAEAHNNLGIVLKHQGRLEEAAASFRRALDIEPSFADALANLASLYERFNQPDQAAEVLQHGLVAHPDHPHMNLVAARLEQRQGRFQEAIERLLRVRPAADNSELAREIAFLLAQLYDQAGRAEEAFAQAVEANCLAMQTTGCWYADRRRFLRRIELLRQQFTEDWVKSWSSTPPLSPGKTPVFLVGFPRSGTTLLDVILDGHPRIQTLEEQPAVQRLHEYIDERLGGYPRGLARLQAAEIERLREIYFDTVEGAIRRDSGRLLVDKFPLNLIHTGLVLRVFPAARFILVVRHPCDVCLSCLLQNFQVNPATANLFTLEDAAFLYARVMALHQQYLRVLPHPCHVVRYEDLVADLDRQTRRILQFLGLPWDENVLRYTRRAVERGMINTPSYGQVTQPIYRRSCGRWRRYAEYFAPVIDLLRPQAERFGYRLEEPTVGEAGGSIVPAA